MEASEPNTLRQIYDRLWSAYGPQHWWPADSPTEVVIGAILTQNTAWTNVERAIVNLTGAGAIDFAVLRDLPEPELAELIRPSGTYRVKARRLKAFVDRLWSEHDGKLDNLLGGDLDTARQRLLGIAGIGPETADAILVYAGNRPSFVVDAYTMRVLRRHFLATDADDYGSVRARFHDALPHEARLFNEYHALFVEAGKRHCRKRATCDGCPLFDLPHDSES